MLLLIWGGGGVSANAGTSAPSSNQLGQINSIFNGLGVPAPFWESIGEAESGGNANATNGSAIGLFQLLKNGGQGQGYTSAQLKNPVTNAAIAAPYIATAYNQGKGMGIRGTALAEYTAAHSGHPGTLPATDTTYTGQYASEEANVGKYYNFYANGGKFTLTDNGSSSSSSSSQAGNAGVTSTPSDFYQQLDKVLNPSKYTPSVTGIDNTITMVGGRAGVALLGLGLTFFGVYSLVKGTPVINIAKGLV